MYEATPKTPHRGEMYYIMRHETYGHQIDPKLGRPAVIVSRDEDNVRSYTVMVAYLTGKDHGDIDTQFPVSSGKCSSSKVKCEQVTTVDKNLIGDYIGKLSDKDSAFLDECLSIALDIKQSQSVTPVTTLTEDVSKIKLEREMYKQMYDNLLEKVMVR